MWPPIRCATRRRAALTALFLFSALAAAPRSVSGGHHIAVEDRLREPDSRTSTEITQAPHPPSPPPPPSFIPPSIQDQRKLDFIFRLPGNYFSDVEGVLVDVSFAEWSSSPDNAEGSPLARQEGSAQVWHCGVLKKIYFKRLRCSSNPQVSLFYCLFWC